MLQRSQKRDTIKAPFESFRRTENVNAAVTKANVELIPQVILQRPRIYVPRVAAQDGLRPISTPCIMQHSIDRFSYRIQNRLTLGAAAIVALECAAAAGR